MTIKIKFDKGQAKMLGLMTEATLPDADDLKEMICACVFLEEDSCEDAILVGLVKTYVAVLDDLLFEQEDVADGIETVTYDCNFTSEKIWLKYAIAGYLSGFSKEERKQYRQKEEDEPGTLNECVTPYYMSTDIRWPPELLAEVAYAMGYRDYRRAVEMRKFFENMRKVEIVTVSGE
jgi:hypothetical protein